MTDFERQLERMLPLMREKQPPQTKRLHSAATTLLGFVLGMFAMYCCMLPNEGKHSAEPHESYKLVFDDTRLQQIFQPADIFHCVVRVPIPKPVETQTQRRYGALRESLLKL
jgi:hypothetical protein